MSTHLVDAALRAAALRAAAPVDIVVGNAERPPTGRPFDIHDEQIRSAANTNMLASIRLARAVVPHMRRAAVGAGLLHRLSGGAAADP